jgi:hypothetical protein
MNCSALCVMDWPDIVAENVDQLGECETPFRRVSGCKSSCDFSDCALIWTVFVPAIHFKDATISSRETDSDLVLARSEHSQRGAQQSEQYVDGAQRAIKSKKRFTRNCQRKKILSTHRSDRARVGMKGRNGACGVVSEWKTNAR